MHPSFSLHVRPFISGVEYNVRARILTLRSPIADTLPRQERLPGTVAVVSGGTPDQAVVGGG